MNKAFTILGVESSCDETSCAVVANGSEVLSNVVASQIDLHARFGGVVPEIASRAHIEAINAVIEEALCESGVAPGDLSAVAVANEPGLIGSLLVGLMAAKTLAWAWSLPLIGVNHVYAHAYSPALDSPPIEYPAVALVCSGGHTALYRCESPTGLELLGCTIDDAAGEAFDKVASILNLGYPGGPAIEEAARSGDPQAIRFPRALLKGQSLDFSFSGIKTAVLYHVNGVGGATRRRKNAPPASSRENTPLASSREKSPLAASQENTNTTTGIENFTSQQVADVAASFQASVVDVLRIKIRRAVRQTGAKTILLGGGVSANSALRAAAVELARKLRCELRLPAPQFCGDNAAMAAGLAYHQFQAGKTDSYDLAAHATIRR